MKPQRPPVSVSIATYNKRDILRRCLTSLLPQLREDDEIIVHDDGSSDGTTEMIALEFPRVLYTWHEDNGYRLASMRNFGLRQAKHDIIFQIDDDTILPNGYIDELLKHYQEHILVAGLRHRVDEHMKVLELDPRLRRARKQRIATYCFDLGDQLFGWSPTLFNRQRALAFGGYDEDFNGNWGAEDDYFTRLWTHNGGVLHFVTRLTAYLIEFNRRPDRIKEQRVNAAKLRRKLSALGGTHTGDTIAVSIHTFLRDDKLKNCVDSVLKYLPTAKLYISDAGRMTGKKRRWYRALQRQGHVIMPMPFDSFLTKGRNATADRITEDFILYLDDDFELNAQSNIEGMKQILKANPEVGLVGGRVIDPLKEAHYELNFEIKNQTLFLTEPVLGKTTTPCHIVLNFWLAKREVLDDVRWDNNIQLDGSHEDFFMSLAATPWKVLHTSHSQVWHYPLGSAEYNQKRTRNGAYLPHAAFLKKWNLKHMVVRNKQIV